MGLGTIYFTGGAHPFANNVSPGEMSEFVPNMVNSLDQ